MATAVALPVATVAAGIVGVVLGAWLARKSQKQAATEGLLVAALSDALGAIAAVANGAGPDAQAAYASALSRIGLHGSPVLIEAFRRFQDDATTVTAEGRARLLDAVRAARGELGQAPADAADLAVLLFSASPGSE